MKKKIPEITLPRYIGDREDDIIRKLGPNLETELESIHYFEKARGILYKSISIKLAETLDILRLFASAEDYKLLECEIIECFDAAFTEGWTSSYKNNRFKIYASDFPVRIYWKKISDDIEYLNKNLSKNTAQMIRKAMPTPIKLEEIFVWIKFYMPLKQYDIDNSYYKPIIDGIVRSGLVENDSISNVSFGFKGYYDIENPHMEIFIYPKDNIDFCEILDRNEA